PAPRYLHPFPTRRSSDLELATGPWQAEIQQIYEQEIGTHFAAEEKELFPAALRCAELKPLVDELTAEHNALRDYFSRAGGRELRDRKSTRLNSSHGSISY